jgi:beta-glucosidase
VTQAQDLTLAERISLLSGSDFWHTQALQRRGVPDILLSDGPHGLRVQSTDSDHLGIGASRPATCFPTAVTLASTWDEMLAEQVGAALAAEAVAQGVSVILGPGLNIKRHPLCGRNFEYFSEDPLVSGRMATAMVRGIQGGGVAACLKHYAVNNQEAHRFVVDAVVDERTLREIYLAGFEYAVQHAQPKTVMASYNLINGTYATEHRRLLTDILRDEWGFDGLVVSDWGATNDRVVGIHAGMDLEMPGSDGISDADVMDALQQGRLATADLTLSAQRVLDLVEGSAVRPGTADLEAHDALARQVAAEGAVLLRNDGLLPLSGTESVALIGAFAQSPRFQGAGSSQVNAVHITTAWDAALDRGLDVRFAAGYDPATSARDQALIEQAVEVARAADVVVLMVGLPGVYESEGFDREDLRLPRQHDNLIAAVTAANPRTVVVLSNGAPVAMPWVDQPAAILEAYLGGQASGAAVLDVLYGDAEPGGRLAETFPMFQSDLAADPYFPGEPRQVQYREGLAVGYRHTLTHDVEPLFPFGFGLSFTQFEYGKARVSRRRLAEGQSVKISVPVTNVGERPGSDVVQVYVKDRTGVVARPLRELRGFAKVRLEPSETTAVSIELDRRAFAFYDVELADWSVPTGEFDIEIGRSSEDIVASLTVTVIDGVTDAAEPAETELVAASDAAFAARLGHAIPEPVPTRPFTRVSTVGEIQGQRFGRAIKAAMQRFGGVDTDPDDPAVARMYERSLQEFPLRAAALFSQGKISWATLDTVIDLLNHKPVAAGVRVGASVFGTVRRAMPWG